MKQLTAVVLSTTVAITCFTSMVRAGDLQSLEDRLDIEQVWSRYAQALDTGNPDAYASLFTNDAYIEVDGTAYKGHEQIRALIKGIRINLNIDSLPATATGKKFGPMRHISSGFVLDLHGATATSESYWTEVISNGKNEQGIGLPPSLHRMGRYDDTFVKHHGKWLLSRRIITGDLMMPKPAALGMPAPR